MRQRNEAHDRPSGITVYGGTGALVLVHVVLSWARGAVSQRPADRFDVRGNTRHRGRLSTALGAWRASAAIAVTEETPRQRHLSGTLLRKLQRRSIQHRPAAGARSSPAAPPQSQVRKVPIQQSLPSRGRSPSAGVHHRAVEPLAPTADKAPAAPTTAPLAADVWRSRGRRRRRRSP